MTDIAPELRWFVLIVNDEVVRLKRFYNRPAPSEFPGSSGIEPSADIRVMEIKMTSMTAEEFESFVEVWEV